MSKENDKGLSTSPQLVFDEQRGAVVALSQKEVTSLYKKSKQSGIPFDTLEEVYRRGYAMWAPSLNDTPEQHAFARVNSFIAEGAAAAMDSDLTEKKRGLWDNIHAKRERIKRGSGERMRKPGSKGAPTDADFKAASEAYTGAEKVSKNPSEPSSRFDGTDSLVGVYKSTTPGYSDSKKKTKTVKKVLKEKNGYTHNKEETGEPKAGESVKAAMKRMNALKTPEERAEFLNNYSKGALEKGGFTDGRFKDMTITMDKNKKLAEGDYTAVRSSDVKDVVMKSPYGSLVKMAGMEKHLEPKTVERYAQSVGIPVSGGVIGTRKPQSASQLSQNIKKVYNVNVSPEKIKGYASTFGLKVDEAYEIICKMIIEGVVTNEEDLIEAEYQGREVPLNKPMKGDVKKSKVYVKDPKTGNVKKVNFGDKSMSIKKDQPGRKKSYCARSSGQGNLTDKTKANYWSRRAWDC